MTGRELSADTGQLVARSLHNPFLHAPKPERRSSARQRRPYRSTFRVRKRCLLMIAMTDGHSIGVGCRLSDATCTRQRAGQGTCVGEICEEQSRDEGRSVMTMTSVARSPDLHPQPRQPRQPRLRPSVSALSAWYYITPNDPSLVTFLFHSSPLHLPAWAVSLL